MVKKIYIARVYFTSMADYKERPIFVVKEYLKNDILYLPLTTNLKREGVLITNDDLEKGHLIQESVIIPSKLGVLSKKLLIKEVGMLKDETYRNIMKDLCNHFECGKYL